MNDAERPEAVDRSTEERRGFFHKVSGLTMAAGLVGGYGAFAAIAARFLYPSHGTPKSWLFVAVVDEFDAGTSRLYTAPDGAKITITRRGASGGVDDFAALSSICPHLGCQVHWEAINSRFFCPCHNGAFDPDGKPIAGPPKDADQSLPSFPLKVEKGLLFIEAAVESLVACVEDVESPPGPGHDPCLYRPFPRDEHA